MAAQSIGGWMGKPSLASSLEASFSAWAFTTAMGFDESSRSWKSVLVKGYGFAAVTVLVVAIIYTVYALIAYASPPLAEGKETSLYFWAFGNRLLVLSMLTVFLFVLRYCKEPRIVLGSAVLLVWSGSFCMVLALHQDNDIVALQKRMVSEVAFAANYSAGPPPPPPLQEGCDFLPYLGMPSPDTLLSAPALSPGTVRSLPLHPCPCIPGSHWHCDLHALSTRECTAYDVTFDQYVLDIPHTAALHTCYVGADDQHAAPQMTHSV